MLPAHKVESSFGELIEQGVSLTIKHAIALLNGCLSDGLGKMTFPAAQADLEITRLRGVR